MSKCPGQAGHSDEDPGRRLSLEVPRVDLVDGSEWSTDVQYTLHFSTRSIDERAVSTQSFNCSIASSVCRSIGASTTSPV